MGAMTDQPAQPYIPPAPKEGVPPSGITGQRDIRGLANKAKQQVSNRQQNFLAMMRANTPESETPETKYASAAAALEVNHDVIDGFVDWVLFG